MTPKTTPKVTADWSLSDRALNLAAGSSGVGIFVTRFALVVVLVWIGSLKAFPYEAEGIVPFVANSPLGRFFYTAPATEYRHHMNKEGEYVPANHAWHEQNGTYAFAYALGVIIIAFGVMVGLHPWLPKIAALGSFLVILMSFSTLSFLLTTPECWVPSLGGGEHGVPYLAGPGRLVLKDIIMMGAAITTMANSAKVSVRGNHVIPKLFHPQPVQPPLSVLRYLDAYKPE